MYKKWTCFILNQTFCPDGATLFLDFKEITKYSLNEKVNKESNEGHFYLPVV